LRYPRPSRRNPSTDRAGNSTPDRAVSEILAVSPALRAGLRAGAGRWAHRCGIRRGSIPVPRCSLHACGRCAATTERSIRVGSFGRQCKSFRHPRRGLNPLISMNAYRSTRWLAPRFQLALGAQDGPTPSICRNALQRDLDPSLGWGPRRRMGSRMSAGGLPNRNACEPSSGALSLGRRARLV
jgi:hypothetical protein